MAVAAAATLAVVLTPGVARAEGCDPQMNGQVICTFEVPGEMVDDFTTPLGFSSAEVNMEGGHGGAGGRARSAALRER